MQITKEKYLYKIKGSKGNYEVNLANKTCTCPHFQHRMRKIHQYCKHIQEAIDQQELRDQATYNSIKHRLVTHPRTTVKELESIFNPEAVDDLISRKEINPPTASSTTQSARPE